MQLHDVLIRPVIYRKIHKAYGRKQIHVPRAFDCK